MRENRKEPRKRTKEWAKIVLLDRQTVFNCTVTDVSRGGACLRVGDVRVPDEFHFFRKVDRTIQNVVVKSRRYGAVGVQFIEALDPECDLGKAILAAIDAKRTAPSRCPPKRSDGREIFTATSAFVDTGYRRRFSDNCGQA